MSTLKQLREVLRRIASRRPNMANAFLRCREEARTALKVTEHLQDGDVTDGYHTFSELYAHRCALFVALMRSHPEISWRARFHADGTGCEGWWIGGMELPTGTITYHLADADWATADGIRTLERAPEWDGHTASGVVQRLRSWYSLAAMPL